MDELRIGQGRVVGLSGAQKEAVIERLNTPNATFFSYAQLQRMIDRFGPDAKIIAIQEALARQQNKKH